MIIIVVLVLLALFVVLISNQDPCTTQITTCLSGALRPSGVDVQNVEQLLVVLIIVAALWQLRRSR